MQKLLQGLHHFQAHLFRSRRELFARLAEGQRPETLFITCSDSRIVPSLFTQTEPGDLFILRNAGNILPPHSDSGGVEATVEYAVLALGVKDIIVCGHSMCGAMSALLNPETTAELPAVRAWLAHAEPTRRIIRDHYGHLADAALLTATVEENVLVQMENLRTYPSVATRLSQGQLGLHGWVYKIESGEVFAYDPEQGQYLSVGEQRYVLSDRPGRPGQSLPGI